MIKEGESIVHFKLRVQSELKDLELNNPELVEEYKKEVKKFAMFTDLDKFPSSVEQRRDIVKIVYPNFYADEESPEEPKDELMAGIIAIAILGTAIYFFLRWLF
jgi:hypothetical protein